MVVLINPMNGIFVCVGGARTKSLSDEGAFCVSISIPAGHYGTRSDRADNPLSCGGNLPDGSGLPSEYPADRVRSSCMLAGNNRDISPFELALSPHLLLNHVFFDT